MPYARRVWTILVAIAVIAGAGCLRATEFQCSTDTECGTEGVCEPVGYCSFADASCDGGRRFGTYSGEHAGKCIGSVVPPDAPDAPSDTANPPPFCDAAGEPTLVGCWELEGNVADQSGDGNNGTATNVTYVAGKVGMAARLVANSHIAVADSASLTPAAIAIESWIQPTALPATGTRMGIVDNDGQYGLFLQPTGLLCLTVTATVAIAVNQWTHVACTADGTTVRIYADGVQVAMGVGTPLGAGNNNGAAIGGNSPTGETLVGMIDQVRVWNAARTAAQICTAAGKPSCP